MKGNYYRDFFIQEYEYYKTVCNILEEWGYKGNYFEVSSSTYNPSRDKLVEYIDKKRFFEEILSSLSTRLKMYLELYYQYRKGEFSSKDLRKHISIPLGIYFSAVNWASYLFFEGFQQIKEYENASGL